MHDLEKKISHVYKLLLKGRTCLLITTGSK